MSTTIARPYAKAVFAYALDAKQLPEWARFLTSAALVIADSKVQALLTDPRVSSQKLAEFILQICQPWIVTGGENFLRLLAEQSRLAALPEITRLFELFRATQEKWINVTIISALPISDALQAKLKHSLEKRLQRDIILHFIEDKSLIGGAVIKAGDLVIDGSVRLQLTKLTQALKH